MKQMYEVHNFAVPFSIIWFSLHENQVWVVASFRLPNQAKWDNSVVNPASGSGASENASEIASKIGSKIMQNLDDSQIEEQKWDQFFDENRFSI